MDEGTLNHVPMRPPVTSVAPPLLVGCGLAVGSGLAVATGYGLIAAGCLVISFGIAAALQRPGWTLMVIAAGLMLAVPLADVGPIEDVRLEEVLIPLAAAALVIRLSVSVRSVDGLDVDVRTKAMHACIAVFGLVLAFNALRTAFLLADVVEDGPLRAYVGYALAILLYFVTYSALRRKALASESLIRSLYWVAFVLSATGLLALALGLPLDLGSLRFSIYDYSSGAVRIGFLETVAMIGIGCLITGQVKSNLFHWLVFASALVMSGGRTAFIGVLVASVVYLSLTIRGRIWIAAVCVAGTLAVVVVPSLASQVQVERVTNVDAGAFDEAGRLQLYDAAWETFLEQPVLGSGLGVPATVYNSSVEEREYYEAQLEVGGHGTYASVLKNFGLVGLVPFVFLLAVPLIGLGKRVRAVRGGSGSFVFFILVTQTVAMVSGGNGSDPLLFLSLGWAAHLLTSPMRSAGGPASSGQLTMPGS